MLAYKLHDVHLDLDLFGVKIYKHDIFKNYSYNFNVISCERELSDRMEEDGYIVQTIDTVVGTHSPKWTSELIYDRYFDLMEKYKKYKYEWLKDIPQKLEKAYNDISSELNYYAMMGAKMSMKSRKIRDREKDYRITDKNYLKVKKEYESLHDKIKKINEI